jgi:hypothetical protein
MHREDLLQPNVPVTLRLAQDAAARTFAPLLAGVQRTPAHS